MTFWQPSDFHSTVQVVAKKYLMTVCSDQDIYMSSSRTSSTFIPKTTKITTTQGKHCEESIDAQRKPPMDGGNTVRKESSTERAGWILLVVFAAAVLSLFLVYYNFPKLDPSEKVHVKVPRNLEDAKRLGLVLNRYKDQYYLTVLVGVVVTYVFLQSFAIPGSLFLTILSGYLFPFPLALFLVCFCSAIGAGLCYLLFNVFGRPLVLKYMPERVSVMTVQVKRHRDNLLNYIIFLRITPIFPNWFINISSPVIDVPFSPFFLGTLFGVAPPSCVYIGAGKTLNELTAASGIVSKEAMVALLALAVMALVPVFIKDYLIKTVDKSVDHED